jgi:hypothetical protein
MTSQKTVLTLICPILRQTRHLVRYQVLTAASMKMTVFWDVAPCSLVEVYRRFRGAYFLHHGATSQKTFSDTSLDDSAYVFWCRSFVAINWMILGEERFITLRVTMINRFRARGLGGMTHPYWAQLFRTGGKALLHVMSWWFCKIAPISKSVFPLHTPLSSITFQTLVAFSKLDVHRHRSCLSACVSWLMWSRSCLMLGAGEGQPYAIPGRESSLKNTNGRLRNSMHHIHNPTSKSTINKQITRDVLRAIYSQCCQRCYSTLTGSKCCR